MAVILINPNSTEAMTKSALTAARLAAPDLEFEGWTSAQGPAVIEGEADGARAVPPLLALIRKASDSGADAIIIACFDDTGLSEARRIATCPVIGIGQASFALAGLLSDQAAVITTVEAAVPVITRNIAQHGYSATIPQVLAADTPVLMLEEEPARAAAYFARTSTRVTPGTTLAILGCAGAVTIIGAVAKAVPFPVIDGVTAAAQLCRVLVAASKRSALNAS